MPVFLLEWTLTNNHDFPSKHGTFPNMFQSNNNQKSNVGSTPKLMIIPIGSMYAIYIYGNIYHQYIPNVSIYHVDPMGYNTILKKNYKFIRGRLGLKCSLQHGSDVRHIPPRMSSVQYPFGWRLVGINYPLCSIPWIQQTSISWNDRGFSGHRSPNSRLSRWSQHMDPICSLKVPSGNQTWLA